MELLKDFLRVSPGGGESVDSIGCTDLLHHERKYVYTITLFDEF